MRIMLDNSYMKRKNEGADLLLIQQRLRQTIIESGKKQSELAAAIGVSYKSISAYLHRNVFPSPDTFARLCRHLEISADYLLGLKESGHTAAGENAPIGMALIQARLRAAIADSGMTFKEIAQKVGITYQTVSSYMHKNVFPALDTLAKLCRVLDVSADSVLGISRI